MMTEQEDFFLLTELEVRLLRWAQIKGKTLRSTSAQRETRP